LSGRARLVSSGFVAPIVEQPAPPAEAPGLKGQTRVEEPTRAQRAIARRSAESRATVPFLELVADVDMSACLALRDARGHSLTAMLVSACAHGLSHVPRANAAYRDGRFELYSRVNVGLVVHSADAFSTPTILDADTKSLEALSVECEALIERAQTGRLTPPELAGATFTLSDMSRYGPVRWSPPVTPPHAATIACGALRATPVVRDGSVVAGHTMVMTLACDHRILYGETAAQFLDAIVERLTGANL
jgi:pyruvate dehydrogenase E2 component (dihydrolipoamide acetyltransferase)